MLRIAVLFSIIACPAIAEDMPSPYKAKKNGWTLKSELPAEERDALPYHGFLLLSGGVVSESHRAAVELHANHQYIAEIHYSTGPKGSPAMMAKEGAASRSLSDAEAVKLIELANAVSASKDSFIASSPTADFDVRLILVDEDQVKFVHSYGRPKGALEALFSYTWKLVEEGRPAMALAIAEAEKNSKRYREEERFMSRSVYPGTPGLWNVQFQPGRTDSDINCVVDLRKKSAKCQAHYE